MDLTFTDSAWRDVGLVTPSEGDFAWGADENDFSIDVYGNTMPEVGGVLYLEGSDIGGLVTGYESRTDLGTFSVVGDTWTGVLDRHVLRPDSGSMYWTVRGDVRDCAAALVSRLGMGALFAVAPRRTGLVVTHTFRRVTNDEAQGGTSRYMGGWSAMWQLLYEHGCKAGFAWDASAHRVTMTISRARDWTDAESQSAGLAEVGVTTRLPCNHLVCLGGMQGAEREVLDLYADSSGRVSTRQTYTGLDEIAQVYDDNNHNGDELRTAGTKKLRDLWAESGSVTVQARQSVVFDLGDLVGGTDVRSGISATATVTKKVASFKAGSLSYTYSSTTR